ncbi:MAG: helix-turn-helix transcriptional regulator [Nitrososphaeraceae archaeon]
MSASEKMSGRKISTYGVWLTMVMNERAMSMEKLAQKSGLRANDIEALITGTVTPEASLEEVHKIAEALLANDPRKQMDKVLDALKINASLSKWSTGCDGGCCPWNVAVD